MMFQLSSTEEIKNNTFTNFLCSKRGTIYEIQRKKKTKIKNANKTIVSLIPQIPCNNKKVQSTLVISNSKGLSEILRDIRTSKYQICRVQEKIIRLTTFNKYI